MKFKELIAFEPIESIVKLKDADVKEEAKRLVKTYVMSDSMADSLINVVLPQLQFQETIDNKGVFIVGNYGTGKSHLMSVISAISEDEGMLGLCNNERFKNAFKKIAGKFEVLRFEIGATKMNLRDIILKEIEKDLEGRGITYQFPTLEDVANNKYSLIEMMGHFQEKYPNKGYLIVVDELLDYLRTRTTQEIMLDLGFLRELGEVCKSTPIRFIAGVQESLFDSKGFSFVANSIQRVKDRFEQIMIKRQDIAYVVSQRLLKKNEKQKAWIREHLQKFSHLYKNMSDRLDDYVDLFPIHPAYLETFEKVYIAEKREVLKTITLTIRELLEKDISEDEPGIISYDTYWDFIKLNPSMKADPDVREVLEKSAVLESLIRQSYTRPQYKNIALKVIYALSVHRLTTGDIYVPVGVTVDNLKDDLCIYINLPEDEEDFLRTTIETVIKEILKTVSGQFISFNSDNEQYYLDLKKDIDYNAKIRDRADVLDEDRLNEYYYSILKRVLDWDAPEYVPGHKIWQYDLMWEEKKVYRSGYLFMGAPNERPTAQPPRDFYIYFISPFGNNHYDDEKKEDEVFFEFINIDDEVKENIKMYAAAMEMYDISTGESKSNYYNKAKEFENNVIKWISKNLNHCFTVRYKGESRSIFGWVKGKTSGDKPLKDYIDITANTCLSIFFNEKYPDYPKFTTPITRKNINELTKAALNYIAGKKTDIGAKILDSLELMDGNNIQPNKSTYAKYYLKLANKLPIGQVLTRKEIFEIINDEDYDKRFKLEPNWVVVVLSTLVYTGDIILSISGKKFDATMLSELANTNTADLIDFKHIEKPKDLPISELKKLFELLEIPTGQITNPGTRETAIISLHQRVDGKIKEVIESLQFILGDNSLWGRRLIEDSMKDKYKQTLNEFKNFLDDLKKYNTPGKLKNFSYTEKDIDKYNEALKVIHDISKLKSLRNEVNSYSSYLSSAKLMLKDDSLITSLDNVRKELEDILKDIEKLDDNFIKDYKNKLLAIKKDYINKYLNLHKKYRLDLNNDNKKKKIVNGKIVSKLNRLRVFSEILTIAKLDHIQNKLSSLKTCYNLTEYDLQDSPICPHCHFNPSENNVLVYGIIDDIENELENLYKDWSNIIINSIDDDMVKDNIKYLKPEQQKIINNMLETRNLPDEIDGLFISAINDLMKGLDKIELTIDEIKSQIFGDGPITIEDMNKNIDKFIEKLIKGKDSNKIRIIVK